MKQKRAQAAGRELARVYGRSRIGPETRELVRALAEQNLRRKHATCRRRACWCKAAVAFGLLLLVSGCQQWRGPSFVELQNRNRVDCVGLVFADDGIDCVQEPRRGGASPSVRIPWEQVRAFGGGR